MVVFGADSRISVHPHDSTVEWAHPVFVGGSQPHNHVIPEARTPYEKSALGDHIDRYHAPLPERTRGV
jgi:hypothetical protein